MGIFDFKAIEKVYETALTDVSHIVTYSTAVAGIAALIYLCSKIWKQWANGGQIDFYGLLRPFAILLVLINFSYVPMLIEGITSPLITFTEEMRKSKNELYNDKAKQLAEMQVNKAIEKANNIKNAVTEDWDGNSVKMTGTTTGISIFDDITTAISDGINSIGEKIDNATGGIYTKLCQIASSVEYFIPGLQQFYWIENIISHAISTLCEYLCIAVSSCIVIFAYLTKVVLVLLGPIVFAFSIFPGFNNILLQWLCRYINVCLWVPICNIIGYFMQTLTIEVVMNNAISSINDPMLAQATTLHTNNLVGIIFLIISIILYAMVPKISNWIISGDGSGMFADAVGSTAGSVGRLAARSVGARIATKGISKAVGNAVNK